MYSSVLCLVTQSCPAVCNPMDCSTPGSYVHGDSPGKNTGVGCHASSKGSSQPRIEPRSPTLQGDSLLSEPPGKPRNTGVGNVSLLHGIFQPGNWTRVSCFAGGFFTSWTIREAQNKAWKCINAHICVLFPCPSHSKCNVGYLNTVYFIHKLNGFI